MWECPECGCEGIIIGHCPVCGAPKPESEEEMPKSTVGTVDGEVPEEPLPLPPKSALKADHVDYAVQQGTVSREVAESMTKDELIDLNYKDEEGGKESSAGTSSSTSESKQEPSGSSAPETGPSLQSHAQGTESLSAGESSQPRDRKPESSDADSADGPSHETGHPQRSRQGSSEAGTPTNRDPRGGRGER